MKQEGRDIRSGGSVVGHINVPIFESYEEASKALGGDTALSKLNRQHASDLMNEFRASKTRTTNPLNALAKMAKSNPDLQKQMEALIKKYMPGTATAPAEAKK